MNTLFPLITEYNEEFKEYYTYRQIYFKWNINSEAYRLHKQYTDFPDSSYYWVYPKGEEPKERHVLFGTYYVQHEIWKHQFPATCEDKKFLIAPLWHAGIGSVIHVLTQSLTWAISTDRIMIPAALYHTSWGDPEFCDDNNQSVLCYLQPMTNCTVSEEDIQKAFNDNNPHISPNHAHISNFTHLKFYPQVKYLFGPFEGMKPNEHPSLVKDFRSLTAPFFIRDFIAKTRSKEDERWYWRIQATTFITRLNEKSSKWIAEYQNDKCSDCLNEYDISLNIRHADKKSEMKLIEADVYKDVVSLFADVCLKDNYTVYVNADDQESVDIIHTLPYHVISFNHSRYNYGFRYNSRQQHIGLISFANLLHQIRGNHCVGTMASNWSRLIYELKMTVGMKSDGFIFEVGNEPCISQTHCSMMNRRLNTMW